MIPEDRKLLLQLAASEITEEQFRELFSIDFREVDVYLAQQLVAAYQSHDADEVEFSLLPGFATSFTEKHTEILER